MNGILLFLYNVNLKKFLVCIDNKEYAIKEYPSYEDIPAKYLENTGRYRISNGKYVMKKIFKEKKLDFIKTSFQTGDLKKIYEKNLDIDEVLIECLYRKFRERVGFSFSEIKFIKMDTLDVHEIGNRRIYIVITDLDYEFKDDTLVWMDEDDIKKFCEQDPENNTANWSLVKTLEILTKKS